MVVEKRERRRWMTVERGDINDVADEGDLQVVGPREKPVVFLGA